MSTRRVWSPAKLTINLWSRASSAKSRESPIFASYRLSSCRLHVYVLLCHLEIYQFCTYSDIPNYIMVRCGANPAVWPKNFCFGSRDSNPRATGQAQVSYTAWLFAQLPLSKTTATKKCLSLMYMVKHSNWTLSSKVPDLSIRRVFFPSLGGTLVYCRA